MRPTRFGTNGVIFYLVMLGAFFASPYSNLFFLLLGFLTLLGVVGALAAWRNLRGVTPLLAELPAVPSDTEIEVPLLLQARAQARFQVAARLVFTDGRELAGRIGLLEGAATLVLRAPSLPRGCYAVQRALVESRHPFGLLRVFHAFEAPAELVVYPAPRALFEGRSAHEALDELLGRADPQAGNLQPASLRDHRAGDEVRGIHWRASARRGRLVVQEWEGGSGQGLEVVLDRRSPCDQLEEALATISAMVSLARTNKETLRLHTQDLSATYGEGQRPWSEVLRFLAAADALPADGPAPPATSPTVARLPRPLAHA